MTDNTDDSGKYGGSGFEVVSNGGADSGMTTEAETVGPSGYNGNPDWSFFDIDSGAGQTFSIYVNGGPNGNAGIGAVSFDSASLSGANNLPASSPVKIASGATLDLGGAVQQIASLSDYSVGSGGSIVNSAATTSAVLTLSPTGGSTTFSGTIDGSSSGAISLVMSGSGTQILAGSMTGPGSLTVNSGELILSGTNSYSGGTIVDAGTLAVTSNTALPAGTSLTVGAGGTFIFDPSFTGSPVTGGAVSAGVAAVPEPSTIVLLLAALWSAAAYRRLRSRREQK